MIKSTTNSYDPKKLESIKMYVIKKRINPKREAGAVSRQIEMDV